MCDFERCCVRGYLDWSICMNVEGRKIFDWSCLGTGSSMGVRTERGGQAGLNRNYPFLICFENT